MSTSYYHVIKPTLPTELATQLEQLCQNPSTELLLNGLIHFVCGADCPETLSDGIRTEWSRKQQAAREVLGTLNSFSIENKRTRTDDGDETLHAKRRKLGSNDGHQDCSEDVGLSLFTLHALSVTSPIRKKVDITIHERALRFTSLDTHTTEATVPLSSLRRAFLLPTRGKGKAHWTIVLISSDAPVRGKPNTASAQASPQVIFGIDAIASSPLTTTRRSNSDSDPQVETTTKGGKTLPSLRTFLSHLGIQLLEPTADVFKSGCSGYGANTAGQGGIPAVEAYRAAKVGSLWFMKEGVLWGESKPCEFWAVEDLLRTSEGLRLLAHPGGRTCSLTLARKSASNEEQLSEDEEDVGIETEFNMIDARELESINQWVRTYRHLFGNNDNNGQEEKEKKKKVHTGPITIHQIGDDEDEEDDDFAIDSSDEDSPASGSDSGDSSDNEKEDGSEGVGSGTDSDEDDEEEEEELDEKQHPLLRPGALPRMSKAAIEMAATMVIKDLLGDSEGEEEDELDE